MALVRRQLKVCLIDVGLTLPPQTQALVDRLKHQSPEEWDPSDLNRIRVPVNASASGITQKLYFGSPHAFGRHDNHLNVVYRRFGGDYSLAEGGFSTVWGAAILPVVDSEIDTWPIKYSDLEPFYRQVLTFVPLAARSDALSDLFPDFAGAKINNLLGPQGEVLSARFATHKADLIRSGIRGGTARLAVRPNGDDDGCRFCGLCVYGCPYDSIYCSAHTLRWLIGQPNFRYLPNRLVESFTEEKGLVSLRVRDVTSREQKRVYCAQLYLACGAVPTAKLVLASTNTYDRSIPLLDNKMALFPFFFFRACNGASSHAQFTLTQNFFELAHAPVTKRLVHLQTYPYSDVVTKALSEVIPDWILGSERFARTVSDRMMIFQILLHSDDSDGANVTLSRNAADESFLTIEGNERKSVREKLLKLNMYLFRNARLLGGCILPRYVVMGLPGNSHHLGGTFPMMKTPAALQTDTEGRLYGYSRVRIVDASVLPSLPAATLTFTSMANAYRVGSCSPET
jgi:choline dehydrogenase-like flavoprotein